MIGNLRHRLIVKTVSGTSDGMGGSVETVTTTTTVWGQLNTVTAKEVLQFGGNEIQYNAKARVRFTSQINNASIIEYGGRSFWVVGILEDDYRRNYMTVLLRLNNAVST
jgi:SPP1 family predicted phage head-tail adaptor